MQRNCLSPDSQMVQGAAPSAMTWLLSYSGQALGNKLLKDSCAHFIFTSWLVKLGRDQVKQAIYCSDHWTQPLQEASLHSWNHELKLGLQTFRSLHGDC